MSEFINQRLPAAIEEVLEESGPLRPQEIADLLRPRGWRYASAKAVNYALRHDLVGRVSQGEGGRWSLVPSVKVEGDY